MKIYRPSDTCFDEMKSRMNRRALPEDSVRDTVNAIIQDVSARGDEALLIMPPGLTGCIWILPPCS